MADIFNQTTRYRPQDDNSAVSMRLTIFDGGAEPVEFDLTYFGKAIITFGRDKSNDIQLNSQYVSHKHGQIKLINGNYIIEDSNSLNGLIFNGLSIENHILDDGDSIRIDDGVESTTDGVLFVFSRNDAGADWKTFSVLNRADITIGRNNDCDIILDHVSVSKLHARIAVKDNLYYLIDNNSTNGIIVNGRKIAGRCQLHEKDLILITNSKLIFGNGKISYCCFKNGISVNAQNLVKRVDRGKKTICDDVSLDIKPCELVAIIGGSGAGKSTVMNMISGYSMPSSGSVMVNGVDLYENFDALKNIIGYVPQSDIVYDNLTVYDMLSYAAKLRLPKDITNIERKQIIDHVIETVELTNRRDTMIRSLSGGQKKRASIAVELLSDPNLLFLDEPASGLDPGTERNLMKTLKSMAVNGKTVIFVTHSTLNLHMCDKIIFMGAGGNLCFLGGYEEALNFFRVGDVVDVYNLITENSQIYKSRFLSLQDESIKSGKKIASHILKNPQHIGRPSQIAVLCKRNLHIMFNDRIRLLLIFLQAPLLAALISLVADGQQFVQFEMTKSLLFAMSCSAFWIGILNSIQEVCKERNILKREYMTGLRLNYYILAKTIVMGLLCAIQSLLLTTVFVLIVGKPSSGVVFSAYTELALTTFLTAFAASSMGIFVSSLFKNADRAMTVAPILLMPQLLFSGLIFTLEGASKAISWVTVCRFSMEAYGTTVNLNSLTMKLQQQGFQIEHKPDDFFTFSQIHFASSLAIMCVFILVFSLAAWFVLRNIKNDLN